MDDPEEIYLRKALKNWGQSQVPPRYERERLLRRAAQPLAGRLFLLQPQRARPPGFGIRCRRLPAKGGDL